jgi:hypothetical protein
MKNLFRKIGLYSRKFLKIVRYVQMFRFKSADKRFEYIFKNNLWDEQESASGEGSTLSYTKNVREHLPKIFKKFRISSVLDAPCGDFNWMQYVLRECDDINYIGGDIVDALIQENNRKYATSNISFVTIDITKDSLPDADLIIVRDCLFHLSYSDISLFLTNLSKSNIKYILTTSHVKKENANILTGHFREMNLFTKPFSWCEEFLYEIEEDERSMYLFKCDQLPSKVNY